MLPTVVTLGLTVPDARESWVDAGFHTSQGCVHIGPTPVELDASDEPGLRLGCDDLSASSPIGDLDGIPISTQDASTRDASIRDAPSPEPEPHPNGIVALDHIVVAAPDLDRFTDAMAEIGCDLRRTRELGGGRQQRFFRLAGTIIEVVGDHSAPAPGPASIWGLALVSDDIDATAASLPGACSAPKEAVQPGRRIATIDNRAFGIGLRLAVMTPHVRA